MAFLPHTHICLLHLVEWVPLRVEHNSTALAMGLREPHAQDIGLLEL